MTAPFHWLLGLAALVSFTGAAISHWQEPGKTTLSEQIELPRLVDLCAQRLHLRIEYDNTQLKGPVTLRLAAEVSDEELWTLTNRLLATRGFTTVSLAGEPTISVVKLIEASALARIEPGELSAARAGYVKVLHTLSRKPTKEFLDSIQLLLTKPGGSAAAVGSGFQVLVSDLKPQVEQVLSLLTRLDGFGSESKAEEVMLQYARASELVTLIDRIVATKTAAGADPKQGKLLPTSDDRRVILVAPTAEAAFWKDLITQFDRREELQTKTYTPRNFGIHEVSKLIEEVVHGGSAKSDGWRIITDELTGSLIITASPSQHAEITNLLARLEGIDTKTRRPMRFYAIKNRNVQEVVEVLDRLLLAGAIDNPASAAPDLKSSTPQPQTPTQAPTSRPANSALTLTADKASNTLIAVGEGRLLEQLEPLLAKIDVRQPQVLLEVLVVSLNDSDIISLGVELQHQTIAGNTQFNLSSLFGLGSPGISGAPAATAGTGFGGVVLNPGDFSVLVRALETINHGRTLTMPKLVVANNMEGRIDSVLQSPYASTNASTTVATTSFGGSLDAGTTVSVRPQLTEADHLNLEYTVTLSAFIGTAATPQLPPPRQQSTLKSSAAIPDGYTVALGGLEIQSDSEATSQIPLLGDIPILGAIFRSKTDTKNRTKFYVFLRASVLRENRFEDLKYRSDLERQNYDLDDGSPTVEPRVLR